MPSPWKGVGPRLDNIIHNNCRHLFTSIKLHPTTPKHFGNVKQPSTAKNTSTFVPYLWKGLKFHLDTLYICDSIHNILLRILWFVLSITRQTQRYTLAKQHETALTCQKAVTTLKFHSKFTKGSNYSFEAFVCHSINNNISSTVTLLFYIIHLSQST